MTPSYECYAEAYLPVGRGNRATLKVFRPVGGGAEVLALLGGERGSDPIPLVRLQSACLTGEVFASLNCDCGEQLRTALAAIAQATWAILLYLPIHEGRGIGLVNKIRAYALQEGGLDTVAANQALGFPPDARDFAPAVAILAMLGVDRVRLMTNNPQRSQRSGRPASRWSSRYPPSSG
ncbi:MAG: GTP cyclohydrolase II [Candidatus Limnocylindria bacterium]